MAFYLLSSKSKNHDCGDVFIDTKAVESFFIEKKIKNKNLVYVLKVITLSKDCWYACYDDISDVRRVLCEIGDFSSSNLDNYIDKLLKEEVKEENTSEEKIKSLMQSMFSN